MEVQTQQSLLESLSGTIKDIYKIANETPIADFKAKAFSLIQNHVEVDSGIWVTRSDIRPDGFELTYLDDDTYQYNQAEDFMENYQRLLSSGNEDDRFIIHIVANAGTPVDIYEVIPKAEWKQTLSYKDHCSKYGLENMLSCVSPTTEPGVNNLISLYRADEEHVFTVKDKQIFQLLFPHLSEAFRINVLSSFKRPSQQNNAARAVCDRFGSIVEAESAFYSLAESIIDSGKVSLDFDVAQSGAKIHLGEDLQVSIDFIQGAFYLEVVQQTQINLTKREKQIAALVSQGLPDKSISEQLEISPSTVNNHLNNIFKKVRVKNRTALIAQLSKQGALEC